MQWSTAYQDFLSQSNNNNACIPYFLSQRKKYSSLSSGFDKSIFHMKGCQFSKSPRTEKSFVAGPECWAKQSR